MKQMFDIFAKLVTEQDEISGLETIGWEKHYGNILSLIGDERIINLQRTKVYVFSDSVLCLGKIHQNPESNEAWKKRIEWITSSQSYRNFDGINGESTEFEWNIFPGFDTLQLCDKVKDLLSRLGETPANFTGRILFMSMFNDISCGTKDNEQECLANARLVSLYARKFGTGQWSFIGSGSEKKWYSIKEDSPQGIWDNFAEKMLVEFAESRCPIFGDTTPLSRGQLRSKGHVKLSIHFAATQETIETIFRIIVSANQLSLYGAVAEMCEEYESFHDRSGRPDMVMGQSSSSLVLGVIKTEVLLDCDDPTNQDLLLQQYGERIEKLSQQDRLSQFLYGCRISECCWNWTVFHFMTKDTGDFRQFRTVACREYTLPREEDASQPRGWIQGNTKLDPCWKLRPFACMVNMESRLEFGLWTETVLTLGLELLKDQINLWWIWITTTEVPEDQLEEQALHLNAQEFVSQPKEKAKPQRKEPADSSSRIIPMNRGNWIDIEPGKHSLSAYEVSKKVIHHLRHSQQVHREEDGADHFWRMKEHLQHQFTQSVRLSDDRWKVCLAAGGGAKRKFQYCTDDSGIIIYFRALQGHSGRNLIDPSLQDTVVIPSGFFLHI